MGRGREEGEATYCKFQDCYRRDVGTMWLGGAFGSKEKQRETIPKIDYRAKRAKKILRY